MPYLQLDVNQHYTVEQKQQLAKRLSETYASMMGMDIRRVTVAIRELGDGSVWRMIDGVPTPAAMLMCDIRRGRQATLRLEVARTLCQICGEILALDQNLLNVEFTQHAGDEMYHPTLGGWSPEWSREER